ncbi:GNAT family N-acetyltransferase [Candidatus Gracilibacteria bacterium]|nr:GNAT family N-acetyltransferase [Candidatus Gracilibacteria bacterium]
MFTIFADEAVMHYYGMVPHTSIANSQELIAAQQLWFAEGRAIRWALVDRFDDTYYGSCGLHNFDVTPTRAELGYELGRTFWGRGLMREALLPVLGYAFTTLRLNRVEAVVDEDNERSKDLLRQLGFSYEGCLRKRFYHRDRFWDEHYFSLLQGEWRRITPNVVA